MFKIFYKNIFVSQSTALMKQLKFQDNDKNMV